MTDFGIHKLLFYEYYVIYHIPRIWLSIPYVYSLYSDIH